MAFPPEQVVGSTLDSSTETPFAGRFHRTLGGVVGEAAFGDDLLCL